jgi:hypothetical protein
MAFVIADRVRETSTTIGTGNFTLAGAVTGYQTFDSALDTGDTTYYTIADQSGVNWEVGIGTFTSPATLARTTILSSSNGGSVVTFGAGTKDVFISLPASKTNTVEAGNLAFTGTGQRITGDFTDGTVANRVAFQTSTTNGVTTVFAIPNGTGTVAQFAAVNNSDPTNASLMQLAVLSGESSLRAGINGTGTYLPMTLYTGGSERMRLDTSGNLGIGTSSPTEKLFVSGGNIGIQRTASDYSVLSITNTSGVQVHLNANGNTEGNLRTVTNHPLSFSTNNTERLRIDTSGNVGIGTSSPKAQTHVFGLGQTTAALTDAGNRGGMLRVSDNSSSAGAGGAILFSSAQGDTANSTGFAAIKGFLLDGSGNTVGDLSFSTRNGTADTSLTERFRIGASGQLGIGGANYGTSGQVLTSNGSAAAPSWQAAGGSTGALKNVQVFTSSGTYTRTSGVTTAVVVAVGGGGGGKGATGKTAGGNGGNGGTTSFGSHVTALGGTGSTGTTGGAGGTGGTGATIAIKGQGGGGSFAFAVGANIGSLGGSAGGEGGGAGVRNNSAGNAGVRGGGGSGGADTDGSVCNEGAYAGGGGGQGETCIKYTTTVGSTETVTIGAGGTAGTGTRAGGAGGAGYIIVYEYS